MRIYRDLFFLIPFLVCSVPLSAHETNPSKPVFLFPVVLNGKTGFIDPKGALVIQPRFEDAKRFSDGMAAVKKDGSWGFIAKSGEYLIEPGYAGAEDFAEGLAPVEKRAYGGMWTGRGKP